MNDVLLMILSVLAISIVVLLVVLIARKPKADPGLKEDMKDLAERQEGEQLRTREELLTSIREFNTLSFDTIAKVSRDTREDLERMREVLDRRIAQMQAGNQTQIDEMRQMIGSKLSTTLRESFDTSFKTVSSQMELVHSSMGELRGMAGEMVDLKRVLAGVKQRGTWGEVQLEMLLKDMLAPGQYEAQATVGKSREKVDFVIKIPTAGETVYLPIDSKFPMDRYSAVLAAQDKGDAVMLKTANDELIKTVTEQAKDIKRKYIEPPKTADFAIMFLPSEGMYGYLASLEACYLLQSKFNVLLAGPSTLAALLNSLQIGFRSIAVEQKSFEILQLMAKIKRSFGGLKDGVVSAQKSLRAASNHLEGVESRTRTIEQQLRDVEETGEPEDEVIS